MPPKKIDSKDYQKKFTVKNNQLPEKKCGLEPVKTSNACNSTPMDTLS